MICVPKGVRIDFESVVLVVKMVELGPLCEAINSVDRHLY